MFYNPIEIKLFGKIGTIHRVCDASGEVIHIANSREEAQEWMSGR